MLFAVLVAESGAPKPQLAVDYWADVMVKLFHHVKNSNERGDFLRFMLIFAMSKMILLVLNCNTKVCEKSDMVKNLSNKKLLKNL